MAKSKVPIAHIEQAAEKPQEAPSKEPEMTVASSTAEASAEAATAKAPVAPKATVAAETKAADAPAKAQATVKPAEKKAAKPRTTVVAEPVVEEQPTADVPPAEEAATAAPKSTGATADAPASAAPKGPFAWLAKAFPGHQNAVLGGLCGLVVAILFFAIGFGKTLFVCLLVFIGVTLGQCLDGDPKIINFLRKLILEARNEN